MRALKGAIERLVITATREEIGVKDIRVPSGRKAKAATTDPNRGDIFDQVVAQARKGKYDDLIAAAKAKAATKFDPSTAMPAPSPPEVEHGWYLKTEAGWALIEDVRMPLFVLVVFYTGLFFLLQDKRARVV